MCGLVVAEPKVEIKTISAGVGPAAHEGDVVAIAYTVQLADGTVIEETGKTPYKVQIGAQDIIPGLSQGLVGIKREEERIITIPPELAYGAVGSPPAIPPNATLVFHVQAVYRSSHSHNHEEDGDHGHSHGEMGEDGSHGRPSAEMLERPAISEFLIRDFYTRPWQYKNATRKIWKDNALVTGAVVVVLVLGLAVGRRKAS